MTQISDGERTSSTFAGQQGQGPQGPVPPWTPPQGQAPHWGPVPGQPPYGQPQYWGPPPTGWQQPGGAPYPYPVMQPYFVPVPQPVTRPTSGATIFAFVMSLLWLGGIGSFVGLILGISCAKDCTRTGEGGQGLAIAAAIIGGLGLLFTFLAIVGS